MSERGWPAHIRRVVIVAPRVPDASGGAVVAESYVDMFAAAGLEVEVISVHPGTRTASFTPTVVIRREALHRGPALRGEPGAWRRAWRVGLVAFKRVDRAVALRRFRRRMASYSSDTVVIFTHVAGLALLRGAGFEWPAERPVVVGQHHSPFVSLEDEPDLRDRIVREFAHVDVFTALSSGDAALFAELLPVPCVALPNPVSLRELDPPGGGVAESREGAPVAVALARYSHEKQLDLMIRAFARATSEPPLRQWRLELYGWGPERDHLESVVAETGEGGRIALMGSVEDVRPVLANASCNLLTSRYEGFPMSVLEAAQCGVPSIAFGCTPGIVELLTTVHGRIVMPPSDEAAYVDALRESLGDERALAERGALARAGAAAYSHEAVLALWGRIVGDAVAAKVPDAR